MSENKTVLTHQKFEIIIYSLVHFNVYVQNIVNNVLRCRKQFSLSLIWSIFMSLIKAGHAFLCCLMDHRLDWTMNISRNLLSLQDYCLNTSASGKSLKINYEINHYLFETEWNEMSLIISFVIKYGGKFWIFQVFNYFQTCLPVENNSQNTWILFFIFLFLL